MNTDKNMIYNAVKNEEIIKINYNQENEFSDILQYKIMQFNHNTNGDIMGRLENNYYKTK